MGQCNPRRQDQTALTHSALPDCGPVAALVPINFQTIFCDNNKQYSSLNRVRWSRLSEQIFRIDKWSRCRGWAAMRNGSGVK